MTGRRHVWELGPTQLLLTAHVTATQDMSGLAIESFLSRLKPFLHEQREIDHATIELEVAACAQLELLGRWDESDYALHRDGAVGSPLPRELPNLR